MLSHQTVLVTLEVSKVLRQMITLYKWGPSQEQIQENTVLCSVLLEFDRLEAVLCISYAFLFSLLDLCVQEIV